jgi:cation-transporting P-type ATPase F
MDIKAVALVVGAIPEGLPAAVTIVLAIGVSRMAKRRAIIRKLPAVETLGSTTVFCSDKTGTLTENQMNVHRAAEAMAVRGLRVIACARRRLAADHDRLEHEHVAEGLTFLDLQSMMDPPRPEAIDLVRKCQQAGIAVKLITGDHLATARAVALQIGLKGCGENGTLDALSGRDLEKISEEDLPEVAERTADFARVAPEQKLRLVKALQARGHVVAMTGDGVNDAPALKQADIGVAMGITGTDVAKSAAAMILVDDSFASIEAAVEEGRGVFDNLTKFIVWTLPTNVGGAMILLAAILFGTVMPALPVQLLWVNMTTTNLLGLMLVFEPKETDLMERPPRDPNRPLLTGFLLVRTGLISLIMLVGGFLMFFWELNSEGQTKAAARTAVINVIVAVETAYLFSCLSLHHSMFTIGWFTNRWAVAGTLAMLGAQLLFTYAPVTNTLFHTAPISAGSWLRIAGVAVLAGAVVELEKWIRYGGHRGDHAAPD